MWRRLGLMCVAIAILLSMTGCPSTKLKLGEWVMVLDTNPVTTLGVTFLEGGATATPPGYGNYLVGFVTWMQSGENFSIRQVIATGPLIEYIYAGTIVSPTRIEGTYASGNMLIGNWVATFVK